MEREDSSDESDDRASMTTEEEDVSLLDSMPLPFGRNLLTILYIFRSERTLLRRDTCLAILDMLPSLPRLEIGSENGSESEKGTVRDTDTECLALLSCGKKLRCQGRTCRLPACGICKSMGLTKACKKAKNEEDGKQQSKLSLTRILIRL